MVNVPRKGQETVPKETGDENRPGASSQVRSEGEDSRVVSHTRVSDESIERWYGYLKGKLHTDRTDDLMVELRGEPYSAGRQAEEETT